MSLPLAIENFKFPIFGIRQKFTNTGQTYKSLLIPKENGVTTLKSKCYENDKYFRLQNC